MDLNFKTTSHLLSNCFIQTFLCRICSHRLFALSSEYLSDCSRTKTASLYDLRIFKSPVKARDIDQSHLIK